MASNGSSTVENFSHPHPLIELYEDSKYTCNGCETIGHGQRYRCATCKFDLHQECADCPLKLSSFVHPQHKLDLVVRKHKATRRLIRWCDVCGDHVEGLFYRCKVCEFDVHPLCTQVPQNVRHRIHPSHALTLKPNVNGEQEEICLICKKNFVNCRYRCDFCVGVHVHMKCVLSQSPHTQSSSNERPRNNVATTPDRFDMTSLLFDSLLFDALLNYPVQPAASINNIIYEEAVVYSVPLGPAAGSPQEQRRQTRRSPQAAASSSMRPGAAGSSSDSEKAMTLY